jgi:hypothetical protein
MKRMQRKYMANKKIGSAESKGKEMANDKECIERG